MNPSIFSTAINYKHYTINVNIIAIVPSSYLLLSSFCMYILQMPKHNQKILGL